MRFLITLAIVLLQVLPAYAQEARRRWEMQRQIRLDKFEQVLPRAMRDNGIDMWIVAVKENHYDPLWNDLGRGYVSGIGYYVFTDRGGDRIERAALGPSGYLLNESGAYDIIAPASTLADHVKARNPKRIGLNMSEQIGPADGLSVTMLAHLKTTLGEPYGVAIRVRRETGRRFPLASRRRGDRRLRRSRRHRDPADRTRAVERSDHARQDHARGRRVVDAGSPARSRARLRVRHAVRLRHRSQRHRRDLELAHHPARRRDDDRLGRAVDELRHRREARRLRAEAGRNRAAEEHSERVRQGAHRSRRRQEGDQGRRPRRRDDEERWMRRCAPPASA